MKRVGIVLAALVAFAAGQETVCDVTNDLDMACECDGQVIMGIKRL